MEHRLNLAFVERLSQQSVEEAPRTCKKSLARGSEVEGNEGSPFRIENLRNRIKPRRWNTKLLDVYKVRPK